MTLAIVGSRKWKDQSAIEACVSFLGPNDTVVSGGAKGPDQWGECAALARGASVVSYRPVEDGLGYIIERHDIKEGVEHRVSYPNPEVLYPSFAAAAYARNTMIAEAADRGCAFWDGVSNGTQDTIKKFRKMGKPIRVFTPKG